MKLAEKEQLKDMTARNSKFHYMYMDRVRQDVKYYIRIEAQDKANKALKTASYVLGLFDNKDITEWYDYADLQNNIKQYETTFKKEFYHE